MALLSARGDLASEMTPLEPDIDDVSRLEDEEAETHVRYDVTSYGVDFDVDGIVKRLQQGDIYVPHFQRDFVWQQPQASRFIESLLLGLPVPGVFLYRDAAENRLSIIDGLQRMRTLKAYVENDFRGRPFMLKGVDKEFEGKRYLQLDDADRRRLNDSVIHATVIRQDAPVEEVSSSIYLIFERLNTGGTPLSQQEIRSCVLHGKFDEALAQLAASDEWRSLIRTPGTRGRDQELLLRFFALYYDIARYEKPLKLFLTGFMARNRQLQLLGHETLGQLMRTTVGTVLNGLGTDALRPVRNFNAALADALLVATARRLENGSITDDGQYRRAYEVLARDKDFEKAYTSSTTDPENLRRRIDMATEAFSAVE